MLTNYRPISLLPIFNQILEKLIFSRLTKFPDKHNIIFSGQFGFRTNHSTEHALLLITDKIQRAIEGGLFSCGIFLDLRKAFDTVDHSILLAKLYSYGIRGMAYDWLVSYLSNRSQFVYIGNTKNFKTNYMWCPSGFSSWSPLIPFIYQSMILVIDPLCLIFTFLQMIQFYF